MKVKKQFMHVKIAVIVTKKVSALREIIVKHLQKKELKNLKPQKNLIVKEKKIQKEYLVMKDAYSE